MDTINYNEEQSPIQSPNDAGSSAAADSLTSNKTTASGGFSAAPDFTHGPLDPQPRTPETVSLSVSSSTRKYRAREYWWNSAT